MPWHEDGHSAALHVAGDDFLVKLQCPGDEFCESKQRCHICDEAPDGCEHCNHTGIEPGVCHLTHWADHVDPMEMHQGSTDLYGQTFPAAIRWEYGDGDGAPNWRFAVTYDDERTEDAAAA